MARRRRYKAWPVEAREPHSEIVKRQSVIASMVDISIQEGIKGHNKEIVKRLAPLIHQRAREMQDYCGVILVMLDEEKTGRPPKWYTIIQDIQHKALGIAELAEKEIAPALRRNEMVYIGSVLRCLKVEIQSVKRLLEENPYRPGLEVWEDVVREALKD